MLPIKSLLEEYADTCDDSLLERIIQVYAQHRYESKDAVVKHLTALFTEVVEETLDEENDN